MEMGILYLSDSCTEAFPDGTSPNVICPRNDYSTRSVRLMKHVVLLFKHPRGVI